MAAEYVGIGGVQAVPNRQPAQTVASIPCRKGYVLHNNGTGVYTLRGDTSNCCAQYKIQAKANIAVPEGGTAGAIAAALTVNGEVWRGSRFIVTPAAVDEYFGVVCPAIIPVPRGCCVYLAFEPVPASDDPTVTPVPVVNMQDIVVDIERIA